MFKLVSIFIVVSLIYTCLGIRTTDGGGDVAAPHVTGSVTYLERVALPPKAVIKVQLVDVSRADAPAVALGEQIISTDGKQVPFFFEIPFDPSKIEANHTYAVKARIEEGGHLLFINDQLYPVITRDAPIHVDMVLRSVNG